MLALGADVVGREFRGAVQTGAYRYLARADGAPFGYVDCGTFVAPGRDRPTGSIAFAVDPQLRGRWLGGGDARAAPGGARRRSWPPSLPPASPLNGLIPVGFQGICTLHGV